MNVETTTNLRYLTKVVSFKLPAPYNEGFGHDSLMIRSCLGEPIEAFSIDIAEKLRGFWREIRAGKYHPRDYVVEHLSLVPMFLNFMGHFCDILGIPTVEPVPPIKTKWTRAFYPPQHTLTSSISSRSVELFADDV
jgi:hypothetical protein